VLELFLSFGVIGHGVALAIKLELIGGESGLRGIAAATRAGRQKIDAGYDRGRAVVNG
jgi:hypothetical protein